MKNKQLLEDNINLFYKFCEVHKVYDEDVRQELFLQFYTILDQWDESRGAFSTFLFVRCDYLLRKIINPTLRQYRIPPALIISLEDETIEDNGAPLTIETLCGEEDEHYEQLETNMLFNTIVDLYKKKHRSNWKRNIDIFYSTMTGEYNERELGIKYNITHQRANAIKKDVQKFFSEYLQNHRYTLPE